jgi:hypothetical protein
MAATSTEQLARMLLPVVAREGVYTIGAFPADQVPTIDKTMHCCFILNTGPRGQPGEHWLAFFYNHCDETLEYFDSHGMTLDTYGVVYEPLRSRGLITLCAPANSAGCLQSDEPLVCGHYSIAFLYWRTNYVSAPPTRFSISLATAYSTPLQRDRYVLKIVRDLLTRGNCCADMLTRSNCSQSCTCVANRR